MPAIFDPIFLNDEKIVPKFGSSFSIASPTCASHAESFFLLCQEAQLTMKYGGHYPSTNYKESIDEGRFTMWIIETLVEFRSDQLDSSASSANLTSNLERYDFSFSFLIAIKKSG